MGPGTSPNRPPSTAASDKSVASPRKRLPPAERRRQLLDAAKEILERDGPSAVTMEGIAARAGVDKTLPYRYFANAHSVLVELYQEYSFIIGTRVATAAVAASTLEAKVEAAVTTYLDVIADHRVMLGLFAASDTTVPTEAEERLESGSFVVELFVGQFGVPRPRAAATAQIVLATLDGTARAWAKDPERRTTLQRLAVASFLATITAAAEPDQ